MDFSFQETLLRLSLNIDGFLFFNSLRLWLPAPSVGGLPTGQDVEILTLSPRAPTYYLGRRGIVESTFRYLRNRAERRNGQLFVFFFSVGSSDDNPNQEKSQI